MKKLLAFLVAIGLVLTSGAALSVAAGDGDEYIDLPPGLASLPLGS
jgi:hypothetical protein